MQRIIFSCLVKVAVAVLIGGIVPIFAQPVEKLVAKGNIPQDFLLSSYTDGLISEAEKTLESEKRKDRKNRTSFFQESSFYMLELLQSGKVLFNDPISTYIGQVGENLLKHIPEAQNKIRFYAVKSSAVNAFTTSDGIILVNLGLISRLKNEAQLAFILSHEIHHYLKGHLLDIYLESKEIEKERSGLFKGQNVQEILLAKNNYTKEKEIEADLGGLELFLKSDYDPEGVYDAFQMLAYANLPEQGIVFKPSFLDLPMARVPRMYFLQKFDPIEEVSPIKDSLFSSHPSISKRRSLVISKLGEVRAGPSQKWILGERKFLKIHELSKRALCEIFLQEQQYERAIYAAYQELANAPQDHYYQRIFAYSLYALAAYGNTARFWDFHTIYEEVPGPAQPLYYLMEKLDDDDRSAMALSFAWNVYRNDTTSEESKLILQHLLNDFQKLYQINLENLPAAARKQSPYVQRCFKYLVNQQGFNQFINDFLQKKKEQSEQPQTVPSSKRKDPFQIRRKGLAGGINRAVFVNPSFQYFDLRPGRQVPLSMSLEKEGLLKSLINEHAEEQSLSFEVIDPDMMDSSSVERFNDFVLLNEWNSGQIARNDIQLVNYLHDEVQSLSDKYNSDVFIWHNSYAIIEVRPNRRVTWVASAILPLLLPYSIYKGTTPSRNVLQLTTAYDLRSGKQVFEFLNNVRMRDAYDVLDMMVYDWMIQLTADP